MSDITERLRGLDTYGYQSQLACQAADEIERLRAALRDMLKCTPFIKHDPRGNGWATIVYDCGDPWEIARAALGEQP